LDVIHYTLKKYLLGPVLGVARCILLLANALLIGVAQLLVFLLYFPVLRRPVELVLVGALTRLALFLIGVHWIHVDTVTLRRE
jgi:hypothetical protein